MVGDKQGHWDKQGSDLISLEGPNEECGIYFKYNVSILTESLAPFRSFELIKDVWSIF